MKNNPFCSHGLGQCLLTEPLNRAQTSPMGTKESTLLTQSHNLRKTNSYLCQESPPWDCNVPYGSITLSSPIFTYCTDSPDLDQYIYLVNKLRESDKRSKNVPFGDYFVN